MMRYFIVGNTVDDAQGYAMRMKPEHKGQEVRIMSVQQVEYGALRGLGGDNVEVTVLERAWRHPRAVTLGLHVDELERRGVKVVTPKDAG